VDSGSTLLVTLAIVVGSFAAYNLFHYILYLLVIHPKKASNIGHLLNDFERRQLIEWTPKDVFGRERQLQHLRISARDLHASL
jgi:hypothetical protein